MLIDLSKLGKLSGVSIASKINLISCFWLSWACVSWWLGADLGWVLFLQNQLSKFLGFWKSAWGLLGFQPKWVSCHLVSEPRVLRSDFLSFVVVWLCFIFVVCLFSSFSHGSLIHPFWPLLFLCTLLLFIVDLWSNFRG